jgi:stage V sporulation protein R
VSILTSNSTNRSLTRELEENRARIEQWARDYGLDFYETIFEVLDYEEMNMVAAYGGFPNRYPHWKFGMEFERLSNQ